mmetsp:Transcript_36119/g.92319  ORF Transcript_36119/g.92319 Transcript_36119/m.92319 type:complete len:650 (-) Transcript_36119:136-2085(-)
MASADMSELWERLDGQVGSRQFKKAARTVDAILEESPGQPVAVRAKGVLLVRAGRYEEALALAQGTEGLAFEGAYCLYRLGRYGEALAALQGPGGAEGPASLHLAAQLHHRLGHPKECIASYSELFSRHGDESLELRTNVLAAYVENGRAREIPELMAAMKIAGEASYEVAFNKACGLLAAGGQLGAAEEALLLAQRIGQETLYSEDFTEEEVDEELAPLKAQLAYVMAARGNSAEAAEMTAEVVKASKNDIATHAVAENNLAAVRGLEAKGAAAESLKRLDALRAPDGAPLALVPELEGRLTDAQKEALHCNRAALMLALGRLAPAAELVGALEAAFPAATGPVLLRAGLLAAGGDAAGADALLADRFPAQPGAPRAPTLLRAQLAAGSQPEAAADLLGAVEGEEFAFSPAVTATKLALYKRAGAGAKVAALLEAGLQHWERRMSDDAQAKPAAMKFLLQAQAQLHMEAGRVRDAAESLMELRDKYMPQDLPLLVKLVKTVAMYDPEAAARLGADLPPLEAGGEEEAQADIAAVLARCHNRTADKKRDGPKSKNKRKRKPLLPKGVDPNNPGGPPDPERWLPKWQRSDFRKKKRGQHQRAQAANVKGSQGAGKVDENLDRSSVPLEAPAAGPSSGKAGGKKGGKKGKR